MLRTDDVYSSLLAPGDGSAEGSEPLVSLRKQWRQVLIAGTGFLADAYDLFVVDLAIATLDHIRPLHAWEKSLIASATLAGAVAGQLLFGMLGDYFGRKSSFIATCFLILIGTLGSTLCQWNFMGIPIVTMLALFRFVLGVGVGGEYPLAATIVSENTKFNIRHTMIAAVFSMQGWGVLLSTLVMLIGLAVHLDINMLWRVCLAFGAVPTLFVIYFRTQMEETQAFQEARQQVGDTLRAHATESFRVIREHWHHLVGTTMTWFLLDITFYGTGSFKTQIGASIMKEPAGSDAYEQLTHKAALASILACMALPGYILSILYIDRIGARNLQLFGFYMMALIFLLVSLLKHHLHPVLLIILFGLTFLFSNFGPNATTFVLPATCYPALVRSTCHGISAASGKLGAIVGASAFAPLDEAYGLQFVLFCCSLVCLLGAGFTHMFTPRDSPLSAAEVARATPGGLSKTVLL